MESAGKKNIGQAFIEVDSVFDYSLMVIHYIKDFFNLIPVALVSLFFRKKS